MINLELKKEGNDYTLESDNQIINIKNNKISLKEIFNIIFDEVIKTKGKIKINITTKLETEETTILLKKIENLFYEIADQIIEYTEENTILSK